MPKLSSLSSLFIPPINTPKRTHCSNLANAIEDLELNLPFLWRSPEEIAIAVVKNNGVGLSISEKKQLPNLILSKNISEYHHEFCRIVLEKYSKRSQFWRRLFRAWIHEHNPGSALGEKVINRLKENIHHLTDRQKTLQQKYNILTNTPKYSDIYDRLLLGDIPQEDLEDLGLSRNGSILSDFCRNLLIKCSKYLSENRVTDEELFQFMKILAPHGQIDESAKMIFMVGLIKNVSYRSPSDPIFKNIIQLVENNYPDPSTKLEGWPSVIEELGGFNTRQECIETVKKWRIFKSINFFFDIMEQIIDRASAHQFPDRKRFWLSYFNENRVTDAWIILSKLGQERLRYLRQTNREEYNSLRCAHLSGAASGQCALLLKLGDLTVMEFSHSGKVRIWGDEESLKYQPPKLHRQYYHADDLRANCPDSQMFTHDHYGNWRGRVRNCINKLSNRPSKW